MTAIDPNVVTQADLTAWYEVNEKLKALKTQELLLRNKIYKGMFIRKDENGSDILPKEGTNKLDLNDGTGAVIKADRVINRTVDDAAYANLKLEQHALAAKVAAGEPLEPAEYDRWNALKSLKLGDMVKYKPELALRNYRTLTTEEAAVFDEVLTIKDGTPQLEIMIPKRK